MAPIRDRDARGATGVARGGRMVLVIVVGGSLMLISGPAAAHSGTGLPGGFVSGFRHPFSGLDHLLAMIAVGLWGAFLGRPLIFLLPVIFPTVMAIGALLAMLGCPMPPVEWGIAISVLTLGGCIALAVNAPVWAASLVVAVFALFHGYAHGSELPSAADPVGYSAGFVLATGLLHILGIGIGTLNARPGGIVATRSAGVAIATFGLWFVYRAALS